MTKKKDEQEEKNINETGGGEKKPEIPPKGTWIKCNECGEPILATELARNLMVCPHCDFHFKMSGKQRVESLIDEGTFKERFGNIAPVDPLNFVDSKPYPQRIEEAWKKTGLTEAVYTGVGNINGRRVAIGALDFGFIGGSLGSVMGEKLARTFELACEENLPVITVSTTGGARMQEGILSLMQMAKVNSTIAYHNEKGLLFISVAAHPTTAGVYASFASQGDFVIAEPGALMGFAGPRVIKETIRQDLPEGFQTAEFLLEKGFVDIICHRKDLKNTISRLIEMLT